MLRWILLLLFCPGYLHAQSNLVRYYVDRLHSSVNFSLEYLEIMEFSGRADDYFGEFMYDPDHLDESNVYFLVNAMSLNTAMVNRDKDLHSPDFMNTTLFPSIIFRSDHLFSKNDQLYANGDLTIKSITRSIEIPIKIVDTRKDKQRLMVIKAGPVIIRRSDFNIGTIEHTSLEKIFLGNEVKIWANVLLKSEREEEMQLREQFKVKSLSKSEMDTYQGIYVSNFNNRWQIKRFNDRLYLIYSDAAIFRALIPLGDDLFIQSISGNLIEFQKNNKGTITGFIHKRGADPSKWAHMIKVE